MLRLFLLSATAALLLCTAAVPASAQERRDGVSGQRCDAEQRSEQRRRRSVIGGIAGAVAGGALGRTGVPTGVLGLIPVTSLLSEAIMSLLDCKEQEQAATATNEAVRGGVGTTSSWTSETRPNVSGASVTTGEDRLADGTHCMTVTDIIIVDGEETRAPKRMCRGPGDRGYARV